MDTEKLSLIISGIIAITSLLIPLIQSFINRKSDERKLIIQHLYSDKLKVFEELMDSFGQFRRHSSNIDKFLSALCKSMLYCEDSIKEKLHNIIELLSTETQYKTACTEFRDLVPYISFEIEHSRNKLIYHSKKKTTNCKAKSRKSKKNTQNHK